jgi:hypothetical protein
MNLATPPLRSLATRLLALETDVASNTPPAFRVCDRLGVLLRKLAGAAGFQSLLSRALVLARNETPWLETVKIQPDGRLEAMGNNHSKEELLQGEVALVAQLLGLLHTFIGEPLTMQLVKEAWPAIHLDSTALP